MSTWTLVLVISIAALYVLVRIVAARRDSRQRGVDGDFGGGNGGGDAGHHHGGGHGGGGHGGGGDFGGGGGHH